MIKMRRVNDGKELDNKVRCKADAEQMKMEVVRNQKREPEEL